MRFARRHRTPCAGDRPADAIHARTRADRRAAAARGLMAAALAAAAWLGGAGPSAEAGTIAGLRSDRARYAPGEAVRFDLDLGDPAGSTPKQLHVRYYHGAELVDQQTLVVSGGSSSVSWQPPDDDYRGYLVEFELAEPGGATNRATLGVDVSSDWSRFPRYGFLSSFGPMTGQEMDRVVEDLNRYHINGVQFYDWSETHHQPLAGTPDQPAPAWTDIAHRTHLRSTVRGYVDRLHDRGMLAMSYNLLYGALDDAGAAEAGVQESWGLFRDAQQAVRDVHDLPPTWKSDISLVNPANPQWQALIAQNTADALTAFGFDGWQIDQLGDRGAVFDAEGQPVALASTYDPFVRAMRAHPALADKRFVFNAVNQFGQEGISRAGVEFLYTELWAPHEHYNDLAGVIQTNDALGGGRLNTVLAAYVNRGRSGQPGSFNAPSVLLTDAVIFAFGGAHIELGEHMLGNEYFPNDNLDTPAPLRESLTRYYDFMVAYQNLLRDGGTFGSRTLRSHTAAPLTMWPARQGQVAAVHKHVAGKEVFHLINFTDAVHMDWRDDQGVQPEPDAVLGMELSFFSHKPIGRLWAASPDDRAGLPTDLPWTRGDDGTVRFTLPSLKYWSMLVAEPAPFTAYDDADDPAYTDGWTDGSGGGRGFGPWRLRASSTAGGFAGFWRPGGEGPSAGIDNAGALDRSDGAALASFANKGAGVDRATAFRAFDVPLQLSGDTFAVTLENGLVLGRVGFTLRNGHAADTPQDYDRGARMGFYFQGGDTTYTLTDATGTLDTGVGWTPFGLKVELTLTGPDTYDLLIWRFDEPDDETPEVTLITDRALSGSGAIESLALFQYDTAGGGVQSDVLFNHLYTLTAEAPAGAAADLSGDGFVGAGDLDLLLGQWNQAVGLGAAADLNGDGFIGAGDLDLLLGNWNAGTPPTTLVPEPATLALLAIGAGGAGGAAAPRRRRA